MTYIDKYFELRAEVIKKLKEVLKTKKYDRLDIWNNEEDDTLKYNLPQESYQDDGFYDDYYLVLSSGESFLGYTVENNDSLWFTLDNISTYNLCYILDYLNETV